MRYLVLFMLIFGATILKAQETGCIDCVDKNQAPKINATIYVEDVKLTPLKAVIKQCEANIERLMNPSEESNTGLKVEHAQFYNRKMEQGVSIKDKAIQKAHFLIDSKRISQTRIVGEDDILLNPKKSQLGKIKEFETDKISKRVETDDDSFVRVSKKGEPRKTPSVARINSQGIYGRNLSSRLPSLGNPTRDVRDFLGDAYLQPSDKSLGRAYFESNKNDVILAPGVSKIIKRIEKEDVAETLPKEQRHYLYCR